jgi:hypothetical protein
LICFSQPGDCGAGAGLYADQLDSSARGLLRSGLHGRQGLDGPSSHAGVARLHTTVLRQTTVCVILRRNDSCAIAARAFCTCASSQFIAWLSTLAASAADHGVWLDVRAVPAVRMAVQQAHTAGAPVDLQGAVLSLQVGLLTILTLQTTSHQAAMPCSPPLSSSVRLSSSHLMHACFMLQLLRAVGTKCHYLAAPLGECRSGAACALGAPHPVMAVSVFHGHRAAQHDCPGPCRSCSRPRHGPCRTAWQPPLARSACPRPATAAEHATLCGWKSTC